MGRELMNKLLIYVEGRTDITFLRKLLSYEFDIELSNVRNKNQCDILLNGSKQGEIRTTGANNASGWANLFENFNVQNMRKNTEKKGTNVILFDADFPTNQGGFSARKKVIDEKKEALSLVFDYFLFPNNKDDGIKETLESQIISTKYKPVLDCRTRLDSCLRNIVGLDLHLNPKHIVNKNIMRNFREICKEKKNFKNDDIWDFDCDALSSLKAFLRKYFSGNT